jgi:hypothetical protein
MSPLTLGSLITGAMVLLLLVTSVTTLLVSRSAPFYCYCDGHDLLAV